MKALVTGLAMMMMLPAAASAEFLKLAGQWWVYHIPSESGKDGGSCSADMANENEQIISFQIVLDMTKSGQAIILANHDAAGETQRITYTVKSGRQSRASVATFGRGATMERFTGQREMELFYGLLLSLSLADKLTISLSEPFEGVQTSWEVRDVDLMLTTLNDCLDYVKQDILQRTD